MKKKLLILLYLIPVLFFAQVTTSPSIPILTGEISVIFDATGTPLEDYSGTIYAHTGVTSNGEEWQNVIGDWGVNADQPALTNTSGNLYEIHITPHVFAYYAAAPSAVITQLSFV